MKNQNTAFLMKFLDKFYNHADIPWVKVTWLKLYTNDNTPLMPEIQVDLFGGKKL